MAKSTIATAGIDTSKYKLDLGLTDQDRVWQIKNLTAGWKNVAGILKERGVTRVGIEATGGYEQGVVRYLRAQGFTVLVLQPAQVKAWATMHRRRAKNDRIDALNIAGCTADLEDPLSEPDERLEELAGDLTHIEQIKEDVAVWKTRLEHASERTRPIIQARIKDLQKQAKAETDRIVQELRRHPDLAERLKLVLSVPGIGVPTAIAIVVRMPEIGRLSRELVAALAGLAPHDQDSGQHKGERHISGGRSRLRRSLYAAALPASHKWNPALIALYRRLRTAGKAHKLALVACARKLLIYVNTVVQRGTPWISQSPSCQSVANAA